MKKKAYLDPADKTLFSEFTANVKPLKQDTVVHVLRNKPQKPLEKKMLSEQVDASFYFSDQYQPLLNSDGPVRYYRADVDAFELKKLRRGDYEPELFLDLHGLTQAQAKQEIGALIAACRREHVNCACIMHGHGKHVLKKQTPLWLAQHPDVMAFHQAPKEFGGDAALLVLITLDQ
jgi:DNA-nicking Smr family endonuclease